MNPVHVTNSINNLSNLEAALLYTKIGWYVIPLCWPDSAGKCGCGQGHLARSVGKAPLLGVGYQLRHLGEAEVRMYWNKWPQANIGVLLLPSNLVDVDLDSMGAIEEAKALGLPLTLWCGTGKGQRWLYEPNGNTVHTRAVHRGHTKEIDILANGYSVLPPSRHLNGIQYQWCHGTQIETLPGVPAWASEMLKEQPISEKPVALPVDLPMVDVNALTVSDYIKKLIQEGLAADPSAYESRSEVIFDVEKALIGSRYDDAVIASVLLDPRNGISDKPLENGDGRKWVAADIARAHAKYSDSSSPGGFFDGKSFIPMRLAKALTEKNQYISSPINKIGAGATLYVYQDGYFRPTGAQIARSLAHELLGERSREEYLSETLKSLRETVKLEWKEMNPNAMDFICVQNGMLDWRTGQLLASDPKYRSTFQIQARFDPGAKSQAVEDFLSQVLPSDALDLMDELLGYLLRPDTRRKKAFMLYGGGDNGKSVFLKVLSTFLGADNVSSVSLHDLSENRFKICQLENKLANICHDIASRALEDTDVFKNLVSGDTITVEEKNVPSHQMTPFARLIFSANEMPTSKDLTDGYFNRWIIIRFPNVFQSPTAQDPEKTAEEQQSTPAKDRDSLLAALTTPEAMSTLLNHAITGLHRLASQTGFSKPLSSAAALDAYRAESDHVRRFIKERIITVQNARTRKVDARSAYEDWCRDEKISGMLSKGKFNDALEHLLKIRETIDTTKPGARPRVWIGIKTIEASVDGDATGDELLRPNEKADKSG